MVIYEDLGNGLVKAYSDAKVYIYGGDPEGYYKEAVDPVSAGRTYTETDMPIDDGEETPAEDDATAADYEAALARLGVE